MDIEDRTISHAADSNVDAVKFAYNVVVRVDSWTRKDPVKTGRDQCDTHLCRCTHEIHCSDRRWHSQENFDVLIERAMC